ncbi:hypothetical protein Cgig2_020056 [Carnegiea gigantea]|uniref:Peptidase A1 domain-containing protein n=1 Tax=Carnegiea gigantea TaxID=171969 RepID=A0A9Q1KD27_9CARY|nr:hypothetical protein Cgig2_020056 [Carnegiea gigantea]
MAVSLTVDLGGSLTWVDCSRGYKSSSYGAAECGLAPCASFGPEQTCGDCHSGKNPSTGCNNTCSVVARNPITGQAAKGEVASDILTVQSTDGSNPGPTKTVHADFVCGTTSLSKGLAKEAKGAVGFGKTRPALLSQFDDRYVLSPRGIDVSKSLKFTPLVTNLPGKMFSEYYINVTAIKINGKEVTINQSILTVDGMGVGRTKISTVHPYTVLVTPIFNAVTAAFTKALGRVLRVNPIKPFGACYEAKDVGSTRVGPEVPNIDLVMHKNSVYWRISGANSMVQVNKDIMCLGFVDGGAMPGASVVIGGYQLEDNLVEFDMFNRVGFSSSLLFRQTSCANFNFTVKA